MKKTWTPEEVFNRTIPKYIGDEYNILFDLLEGDNSVQYIQKRLALGLNVNSKYLSYVSGQNMMLIGQIAFQEAVNRVYRSDPEKYKKIWSCQDPRFPDERRLKLEFINNSVKAENVKKTEHMYS